MPVLTTVIHSKFGSIFSYNKPKSTPNTGYAHICRIGGSENTDDFK